MFQLLYICTGQTKFNDIKDYCEYVKSCVIVKV